MAEVREFKYATHDVRVVFGDGVLPRLGDEIDAVVKSSRCMVVCTPGRRTQVELVRTSLGARVVATFDSAQLHVPTRVVADALASARVSQADCFVAVGGGSAIGLGKALARETGTSLIAIPTTYSGSEMTDIWGVTEGERKQTGRDPRVVPRLVVYDPELTYDMPPAVTAASGMNAIAHSVEALYSPARSPVSSMFALDGIGRFVETLPFLVHDLANANARWDAFYGAHLCGRALDMTTMGLHHKLCHVLGGMFDLPHALTHSIVLPYVVAYNTTAAPDAVSAVASILGAPDAAKGLWEFNHTLGTTQTLGDLGVKPSDIDRVVESLLNQSFPNPEPVTADGVRRLMEQAIVGGRP